MHYYKILSVVLLINTFWDRSLSEERYLLKAAKNVPRIGRSTSNKNSNIDEMGKFFMKASKSVPRIGRRNENFDYDQNINKRDPSPIWSDIADRFEYDPEFLTSPEILERLEMRDDPSFYEFSNARAKRSNKVFANTHS